MKEDKRHWFNTIGEGTGGEDEGNGRPEAESERRRSAAIAGAVPPLGLLPKATDHGDRRIPAAGKLFPATWQTWPRRTRGRFISRGSTRTTIAKQMEELASQAKAHLSGQDGIKNSPGARSSTHCYKSRGRGEDKGAARATIPRTSCPRRGWPTSAVAEFGGEALATATWNFWTWAWVVIEDRPDV